MILIFDKRENEGGTGYKNKKGCNAPIVYMFCIYVGVMVALLYSKHKYKNQGKASLIMNTIFAMIKRFLVDCINLIKSR